MNRYVAIHGHFYQPPRENAWLEEVETQDSASPFHDWNERITAECYRPNGWSRMLDEREYIVGIDNNYSRISFNFGPTLLSWLERHAPAVYEAVLTADRASRERFSGHGSALAQAYHHALLPLAPRRDKELQIDWGLRDFRNRFGREAEGMWLPETAVDLETLEVLADRGLRFTILAPHQAARYRPIGAADWISVDHQTIPSTRPYHVALAGGRQLTVFFYDEALSSDIAFRGLLHDGKALADRLATAYDDRVPGDESQLASVATDGESYGHHHPHGDMALAAALRALEGRSDVALTNFGEFLERSPPRFEVEIREASSWSCAHGVERWRSDCGCNSGLHPGWHQAWRAPLREALDHLRERIRPGLDEHLARWFPDVGRARLEYVDVIRDRSRVRVEEYLTRLAGRRLEAEDATRALKLLELERHLQQMYTSCGWFFDEISGIETTQILQYAARAIQLAEETIGSPLESDFVRDLGRAPSNVAEFGNGAAVYEKLVRPTRIHLRNVCAHYALSSLVEDYSRAPQIYSYTIADEGRREASAGTARLALGRAEVRSTVTWESEIFTYGALYLAGHNLFGGVRPFQGEEPFARTARELMDSFERGDLPETIRRVDEHFGEGTYTLRLLFRDEQRKIVGLLYEALRDSVEASFRRIYETTSPILRNLAASGSPAPPALRAAAEFFLNDQIRRALARSPPDVVEIEGRLRELERTSLSISEESVGYPWARAAEQLMDRVAEGSTDPSTLRVLIELVRLARDHQVDVDLSQVQNRYFASLSPSGESAGQRPLALVPRGGEEEQLYRTLGEELRIRVAP